MTNRNHSDAGSTDPTRPVIPNEYDGSQNLAPCAYASDYARWLAEGNPPILSILSIPDMPEPSKVKRTVRRFRESITNRQAPIPPSTAVTPHELAQRGISAFRNSCRPILNP